MGIVQLLFLLPFLTRGFQSQYIVSDVLLWQRREVIWFSIFKGIPFDDITQKEFTSLLELSDQRINDYTKQVFIHIDALKKVVGTHDVSALLLFANEAIPLSHKPTVGNLDTILSNPPLLIEALNYIKEKCHEQSSLYNNIKKAKSITQAYLNQQTWRSIQKINECVQNFELMKAAVREVGENQKKLVNIIDKQDQNIEQLRNQINVLLSK